MTTAKDLVPPVAAVALVVLFVSLGFWQVDRAGEKRALREAFEATGSHRPLDPHETPELFEPLQATGHFMSRRQFLIDNMILDGRVGYYVITPFEYEPGQPLLLVNRGWMPKTPDQDPASVIAVDDVEREIRGRAGRLPRVGIRAGEAFDGSGGWPKTANWPTLDELSAQLGRDVLPFVLLADPAPGTEFARRWEPAGVGPMRHTGYAFQWFALAAAVAVTTVVVYRRRRRS